MDAASLACAQVLRQVAIAAGLGPARPAPERRSRRLRPKQGAQGDDVVAAPGAPGAGLRLRLPARFAHGTVKAAAWQARRPLRLRPPPAVTSRAAGPACAAPLRSSAPRGRRAARRQAAWLAGAGAGAGGGALPGAPRQAARAAA